MASSTPPEPATEPLPRLRTDRPAREVVELLDEAARRGKLPEFEATGEGCFSLLAYGAPFDAELHGDAGARQGATEISLDLRLHRRMPIIYAIVLLLTVEPGRYFADEFLATFLPSLHGHIPTWWWWYPVTIIPIPWLWRGWMRKSRRTTRESAMERIEQIEVILGAERVQNGAGDS